MRVLSLTIEGDDEAEATEDTTAGDVELQVITREERESDEVADSREYPVLPTSGLVVD